MTQDLIKAEQRTKLQLLTAPVDGVVQQLAVHTVGGVVTPAQALLVIVPTDSQLEIEAMVSNRDIGFVARRAGGRDQDRHLQLHPLRAAARQGAQRLAGRHHRATSRRTGRTTGAGHRGRQQRAEGPGAGLRRAHLARPHADAGRDKLVNLSPGMAVTVEIKTGSRSIMSYLLSPLLRYKQESLRER